MNTQRLRVNRTHTRVKKSVDVSTKPQTITPVVKTSLAVLNEVGCFSPTFSAYAGNNTSIQTVLTNSIAKLHLIWPGC